MPYANPPSTNSSSSSLATTTTTHVHSHHGAASRPGHRRSYTGPGAFASLGSLPRRTPPTTPAATATPGAKKSVFHLDGGDDEDSTSDEDAASPHREHGGILSPYPPALKLNPRSTLSLNLNMLRPTVNLPPHSQERKGPPIAANDVGKPQEGGIPFPTSSPSIPSPTITTASPAPFSPTPYISPSPSPSVPGVRPTVVRTASSPVILLSNGKPLKSSLKSSNSSPIISHNHHLHPHHNPHFPHHQHHSHHLRAASAPCTPQTEPTPSEGSTISTSSSTDSLPSTPKNVHFAPKLQSVRVFNRLAKPASLLGEETETETEGTEGTEGESLFPSNPVFGYHKSGIQRRFSTAAAYPFPKFLPSTGDQDGSDGGSPTKAAPSRYKLAGTPSTSQIPASFPSPYANVHLEGIDLVHVLATDASAAAQTPHLTMTGTLLVRNLSYAKSVAVRFTLDEWQTTSEVSGRFIESLDHLPSSFFLAHSNSHQPNRSSPFNPAHSQQQPASGSASWDRFGFTIKLEDFQSNLHEKAMWMVARFGINDGKDEFWDNNSGRNYRVGFDIAVAPQGATRRERARGTSAPAAPIPAMPLPALPVKPAQPQLTIPPYVSPSQHSPPKKPSVDPQHASFHIAAVKATKERLSKLNLRNYAAPVKAAVPPAPLTAPPPTPSTPSTDSDTTPIPTPSVGIVTTVTPPSPPPPSLKVDAAAAKDETDSSDDEEEMVTPDTSPLVATPKWDKVPSPTEDSAAASVKERAPTTGAGISLYFPWGNATSTPEPKATEVVPQGSPKLELPSPSLDSSDTAYKAFLKQWCFARDSSPSVATGPAVPNPGGIQVS